MIRFMIRNKCLIKKHKIYFGTESLNLRITKNDPLTEKPLDNHLNRYGNLIATFIQRRRINRAELWPKIHIIDAVSDQQPHLAYQTLFPMKKLMRDQTLLNIAQNDPTAINSSFIGSIFLEDYFKQMMDQYVSKVLVCGKAPKNQQSQNQVQNKVIELFRIYYFGQKISPLEREIQLHYLSSKQNKNLRYQEQLKDKKNQYHQCTWTQRDQRLLEDMINWQAQDPNITDLNNRPYFEPLQITSRLAPKMRLQELIGTWFINKLWQNQTKRYYDPTTSQYFEWVLQKIFSRIIHYIRSIQFTSCLNIPHDYMIESQIFQIHFWIVVDRLKKINTLQSQNLARLLARALKTQIIREARSVNLKRSNVLVASLQKMLQNNNIILELHFNKSQLTKNNPYLGIDAMVWTIAFAQKVHRYSPEVYLFADYLVKNIEHFSHHTEDDIFNGTIQFDPLLVNLKHRQQIQAINPPLPPAVFQKQFNSNAQDKDYYYSKIQTQMEKQMSLQDVIKNSNKLTSFSLSQFLEPFRKLRVKLISLKTFDHFSRMEKAEKQNKLSEKKSAWKTQKDAVDLVDKQFQSLKSLRYSRKNFHSNITKDSK